MSRKDFIQIASVIKHMGPNDGIHGENGRKRIAEAFARELSATDCLFKPDLFIQAATGQVALTARKAL